MRLLLDEMWTPTIALELRKRGFDVIAISEPAYAGRYAGISDDQVFARAQDDGRAIVTDNIADYEQAIGLNPQYAIAYRNLASLLATCPQAGFRDGKKAVAAATKACELSGWKDPGSVDILAAADAEAGDFADAVKWEIQFSATPGLSASEAEAAQNCLELYQDHKPFHFAK